MNDLPLDQDDDEAAELGRLARIFWEALAARTQDLHLLDETKRASFVSELAEKTPGLCQEISMMVLGTILDNAPETLAANHQQRGAFVETVARVWGEAFDLFEVFLGICTEVGDDFNRRRWDSAAREDDHCFNALIRLHARACLVGSEVLTLMRAGYASGAHARWRTIHELAVVAYFIREHGDDVAYRYLRHDEIQAYKAACAYREHATALAEEPLTDEEFEEITARRAALLTEFGDDFRNDYGWAAHALGTRGVTFAEIEAAVDLDHFRPYYRMASNAIHPNAHGSFFDLGIGEGENIGRCRNVANDRQ